MNYGTTLGDRSLRKIMVTPGGQITALMREGSSKKSVADIIVNSQFGGSNFTKSLAP